MCTALLALACDGENEMRIGFGHGSYGGGRTYASTVAPQDPAAILGAALKWWFDFDDAGNVVTGQGYSQAVNKGQDATNYAGDLLQATDANRPYARYLRGNRKGMQLVAGNSSRMLVTFSGAVASLSAPYTIITLKQQIKTGTMTWLSRSTAGVNLQTTGTSWPKTILSSAGTSLNAASALQEDEVAVIETILGGASDGATYKNGTLLASGSTNVGALNGGFYVGCSNTIGSLDTSHIGQVLVVSGKITTQQRADLQAYFAYYYGLGLATHWCPTGDSITGPQTGASSAAVGWRGILSSEYTRAKKGGKWLVSTGATQTFGFVDDRHYGVGGDTIALSATRIAVLFGSGNVYNAPIVWYMIGTNNMATYAAGTTVAAYETNVRDIDSRINTALGVRPYIIVSTIPDVDPARTTQHTNTPLYNAELPAAWTAMESSGLRLIRRDLFSALGAYNTTDWYQADGLGVHLSDAGQAKMAAHIAPALYEAASLAV